MITLWAGKTGRPKEEVVFERNCMAQTKAFLVQKWDRKCRKEQTFAKLLLYHSKHREANMSKI